MKWYYMIDGEQRGPVEESELFNLAGTGRLKPTDLVWNETMGEKWAEASTVPGLFSATPPRLPASTADLSRSASAIRPGAVRSLIGEQAEDKQFSPGAISCIAAVGPAWLRMKEILFSPFSLGKWFTLGFTAWLATLGKNSGGSGSFNPGDVKSDSGKWPGLGTIDPDAIINRVKSFLDTYGGTIAVIAVIAVIVVLAIGLVVLWIRSRGKFMFLDNVVKNRAEVSEPWKVFAEHGNSLFLWNIVFGLVCLAGFGLLLAVTFFSVIMPCIKAQAWVPSVVPAIVFMSVFWFVFAIATGYVTRFLEDFIVPIMYGLNLSAMEAWQRFFGILKPHFRQLILYGLFYFVLGIGAGVCVLMLILVTCCIAGCVLIIPYLGAVLLLPVTVFFRAYSIEYLGQFGPEYRLDG